jgi:centrin-1
LQSERDTREEIAKVFALFDPDSHGRITFRELKRVVSELGENISDEEMREMIEEADRDHDGELRCLVSTHAGRPIGNSNWKLVCAGFVTFEDFFRIMKKKSDNPLDDLDDDDDF